MVVTFVLTGSSEGPVRLIALACLATLDPARVGWCARRTRLGPLGVVGRAGYAGTVNAEHLHASWLSQAKWPELVHAREEIARLHSELNGAWSQLIAMTRERDAARDSVIVEGGRVPLPDGDGVM